MIPCCATPIVQRFVRISGGCKRDFWDGLSVDNSPRGTRVVLVQCVVTAGDKRMNQYETNLKSAAESRWGRLGPSSRRVGHGGTAWSAQANLRQPQDGALENRVTEIRARLPLGSVIRQEPEDARLTGGTRSLVRRLLGLNIRKTPTAVQKAPAQRAVTATDRVQVA